MFNKYSKEKGLQMVNLKQFNHIVTQRLYHTYHVSMIKQNIIITIFYQGWSFKKDRKRHKNVPYCTLFIAMNHKCYDWMKKMQRHFERCGTEKSPFCHQGGSSVSFNKGDYKGETGAPFLRFQRILTALIMAATQVPLGHIRLDPCSSPEAGCSELAVWVTSQGMLEAFTPQKMSELDLHTTEIIAYFLNY